MSQSKTDIRSSLAIGSPLSELSTLVSKITAINGKHGPFDACVVVGDLFAEGTDGSEVAGLKCEFDIRKSSIM